METSQNDWYIYVHCVLPGRNDRLSAIQGRANRKFAHAQCELRGRQSAIFASNHETAELGWFRRGRPFLVTLVIKGSEADKLGARSMGRDLVKQAFRKVGLRRVRIISSTARELPADEEAVGEAAGEAAA